MASPTKNSVVSATFTVPSDNILASLLDGTKWGTSAVGNSIALTYSFPTSTSATYNYRYEWSGGSVLSSSEQTAVRNALAQWSAVANVTFTEVADTSTSVGELRFAKSTTVDTENASAWSYMPDSSASAGDTWISPTLFTSNADNSAGSWNYMTLVHEIGHSLGLKHPFETGTTSTATLPTATDDYQYTIMSYSATAGNSNVSASIYPSMPMLYDIAAIQYLYGANYNTNAGDTTYSYSSTSSYQATIWDGGGTDTIVYTGNTGGIINLNAGGFSQLGKAITYTNRTNSANTVTIAYNCTIENANGSNGNDTVYGNSANNTEKGNAGNDIMLGNLGNDVLLGNAGNDYLFGGSDNDYVFGGIGDDAVLGNAGSDVVFGDDGNDYVFGGNGDDSLNSGAGNDVLYGDPGNDTITGGAGNDVFIFTSLDGTDVITDFTVGQDVLWLDHSIFASLPTGSLSSQSLVNGSAAVDGNDYLVFDGSTDTLWYDADGSGSGAAVKVASLWGVTSLVATSILVV